MFWVDFNSLHDCLLVRPYWAGEYAWVDGQRRDDSHDGRPQIHLSPGCRYSLCGWEALGDHHPLALGSGLDSYFAYPVQLDSLWTSGGHHLVRQRRRWYEGRRSGKLRGWPAVRVIELDLDILERLHKPDSSHWNLCYQDFWICSTFVSERPAGCCFGPINFSATEQTSRIWGFLAGCAADQNVRHQSRTSTLTLVQQTQNQHQAISWSCFNPNQVSTLRVLHLSVVPAYVYHSTWLNGLEDNFQSNIVINPVIS